VSDNGSWLSATLRFPAWRDHLEALLVKVRGILVIFGCLGSKGRSWSCSARVGYCRAVVGCLGPLRVSGCVQVKSSHSVIGRKATGAWLEASEFDGQLVSLQR